MSSTSPTNQKKVLNDEFANDWTVTGYKYIYYGTGIRKILWIILLLTSTVLAAYLFSNTIQDYLTYETYVVTNIEYSEDELDFPTITFCNLNPQNPKKAKRLGVVDTLAEYKEMHSYLTSSNSTLAKKKYNKLKRWMAKHNITSFQEAISKLEMSYADMSDSDNAKRLRSDTCTFDNKACKESDMVNTMSWKHSLCYQFNPYKARGYARNSSQVGMDSGLDLYLDLSSEEAQVANFPFNGMEITINPFGTPHMLERHNKAVLVQPGTMNAISIRLTTTILLPYPYSTRCSKRAYGVIKRFPYTKAMCETDCILQTIISKCNCVGFEFDGFVGDTSICTIEQMSCYFEWRNKLKKIPRDCRINCPRGCTNTHYSLSVTQATLGNNGVYGNFSKSNISRATAKERIAENLVGFKISFQTLDVTTKTVTAAATWVSLLADIGGNLGLVMGLSILTVFELIFYIYDYLSILIKRRPNKPSTELNHLG